MASEHRDDAQDEYGFGFGFGFLDARSVVARSSGGPRGCRRPGCRCAYSASDGRVV